MDCKKLFVLLFVSILLIGVTSAFEFDNVKDTFNIDKDSSMFIGDKTIDYKSIWEKYKPIEIKNAFGLGETLFKGAIDEHTEFCGADCYSTMDIYMANDGVLVDDVNFKKLVGDDWVDTSMKNYQFYIATSEEDVEVDDFEFVCSDNSNKSCYYKKVGSHIEKIYSWKKYTLGEIVNAGYYKIKLVGEKNKKDTIDWRIRTNGEWLEEWAAWGGTTEQENLGSSTTDNNRNNLGASNTHTFIQFNGSSNYSMSYIQNYFSEDASMDKTVVLGVYNRSGDTLISQNGGNSSLVNTWGVGLKNFTFSEGNRPVIMSGQEYYLVYSVVSGSTGYVRWGETNDGTGLHLWGESSDIYTTPTFSLGDIDSLNIQIFSIGSSITINSPENYYNTSNNDVNFNCTANMIGATFVNMSLWNNVAGLDLDNGTTTTNGGFITQYDIPDGTYNWSCYACDSDGDCGYADENRSITIDTTAPSINIISPSGLINYHTIGNNLSLNWSVSDTHLDSCWFEYNNTNITVNCDAGNYSFTPVVDEQSIIFWANDTSGNIGDATASWSYSIVINSQTYSATTIETSTEQFIINITYNESKYTSVSSFLNYDSTNYTGTQVGSGNNIRFQRNIDIPSLSGETSEDKTFYWIISLTNATATTNIQTNGINQTVDFIKFVYCNSTQHPFINFSTYNATNPFPAINATFKSSWEISLSDSNGTRMLNRSFEDITENNRSWAFCLEPADRNYTISASIEYDGSTSAKNFYYITDAEFSNQTTNISLYLLADSEATLTVLNTVDQAYKAISDVYIQVQFYDVGTDTCYTVSNAKTDFNGEDLVYLNWYDSLYKFTLVKDGTVIKTTDPYKISSTPQTFQIDLGTTDFDFEKFDDFEYSLTFNNATNNFVLTFVKPSGLVESGCLKVIKRNITNDYLICNTCETSSSATLYCNIAAHGNGTYISTFYALGSLKIIDGLVEVRGYLNEIYEEIGNLDGSALAIIISGIVLTIFALSNVLGVFAMIGAMILSVMLGFQPLDYTAFLAVVIVGGIVIWLLKR